MLESSDKVVCCKEGMTRLCDAKIRKKRFDVFPVILEKNCMLESKRQIKIEQTLQQDATKKYSGLLCIVARTDLLALL